MVFFDITGGIYFGLSNIQVEIEIAYDYETKKFGKLTKFKIDSNVLWIDYIRFDINHVPSSIDGMISYLTTWIARLLRHEIASFIEGLITKEVNWIIAGKTIAEVYETVKNG